MKSARSLLPVAFLAAGAVAAYYAVTLCAASLRPYAWEQVRGEILSAESSVSQAGGAGPPFTYRIAHRYAYKGQTHRSEDSGATRDWLEIAVRLRKYPEGGQAAVYVDPGEPGRSRLQQPDPRILLWLLLPFALWAAAAGCRAPRHAGLLLAWGSLVIGGGIFFALVLEPAIRALSASRWLPAVCTVEFSRMSAYPSSGGGQVQAGDVLFSHRLKGVRYRSSRYSLESPDARDSDDEQAVVQALQPGSQTACYYDPHQPEWVVIDRSFPAALLPGLAPLSLFVIGAWVLLRRFLRRMRTESPPLEWPPASPSSRLLEPSVTSAGMFAGCLLVAVIWNAVVAFAVSRVVASWKSGDPDLTLAILVALFGAVGLVLAAGVPYYLLGVFTPRPRIVLTPPAIRLGESTTMQWQFTGRAGKLRRARIYIEGSEWAFWKEKKNRQSHRRELFRRIELLDTGGPVFQGIASIQIPGDTMPTFEGRNFRIVWELKVHGEIPFWTDVNETHRLEVLPAGENREEREL